MQSIPSLPLLTGPLLYRVIASDRALSMDQIELFYISTVCKQISDFKLLQLLETI